LDISLTILSDNLENQGSSGINNDIYSFYSTLNEPEDVDYICNHPITRRMVRDVIQTRGVHLEFIFKLMSMFTEKPSTEVPCEFYYKHIFTPLLKNQDYPKSNLFALSNIFAIEDNFSFVNLDDVAYYLTCIMEKYEGDDSVTFYSDIYYIIQNLQTSGNLVHVLTREFIYAHISFVNCMVEDDGDHEDREELMYSTLVSIVKTMSQHEHLQHYLDKAYGQTVLCLGQNQVEIERYMNYTLQQQCALVLHRKNQISSEDLDALDIHLHIMA
jgi:hypothetical protein